MFTDKLLVFLEIMVIRLCFTQELSSFGAVGMHLLVHWTVVLACCAAPHPAPRLIGGLRISHHWCVEGVRCGLLLPFEWKASHTSCSFLFHFWLCILNMIWPSLPNLTNNRVSRNKPEILLSLQHLCLQPFFTDMVLGFGGVVKEKN